MNVSSDKFQVHRILRHLLIRLTLSLAELHFTSAFVVDGREQRLSMQKIAWHVRQQSALDTLQKRSPKSMFMQGLWTQSQETHHLCTVLQDDDDVETTIREHLPGKETVIVHCALSQVRGPFCADRCVAASLQSAGIAEVWDCGGSCTAQFRRSWASGGFNTCDGRLRQQHILASMQALQPACSAGAA